MNTIPQLRFATPADAREIRRIYEPYVLHTAITYDIEIPTEEVFQNKINETMIRYPFLVCELNGELTGFAYASRFRMKEAYDWTIETTIYLDGNHQGKKHAFHLYNVLLNILRLQGFINVYAGITSPNPRSENFHEKFGFKEVGYYHKIGYKFNQWFDLRWYELFLNKHQSNHEKPMLFSDVVTNPLIIQQITDANVQLQEL